MSNQYPKKVQTSASTRRLLGLFGLIASGAIPAYAQTSITWANAGSVANTSSNWVGSPTLANSVSTGNIWNFTNTASGNNSVTFSSARSVVGIVFSSTANAYSIGSSPLVLSIGASGITNSSGSNAQVITSPIATNNTQTWTTVAGGSLTTDAVTLTSNANNRTLTIAGAGNTSIGSIGLTVGQTGVGALTKTGAGTLTLTGTNTYAGATTINEGAVIIANGNSSSANANFKLELTGTVAPSLKLNSVNSLATTATLTGAGSSGNAGTVDLAAAGSYTLGSYLGNSMKFSASSGLATTLTFSGNSVLTASNNTTRIITNLDANLSLVFGGTLDIGSSTSGGGTFAGAGSIRVNGAIFNSSTGVRAVNKNDAGTLTLAGVNTYNGDTTISGGKLSLTGSGSIATSPTITNNGTFDVSAVTGGNYTLGSTQTYKGSGTTIGNLTINGAFTPGTSPGLATFNNDLTLGTSSTTTMEIGGLGGVAGTDYDKVSVTGALTYGGALSVVAYNSYNFAQAASFNLFGAGSRSGNFSSVSVAGTSLTNSSGVWSATTGGYDYTFSTSDGNLVIATAVPEPAATAAIGGAALLGLAALRRRRRA
ncbi:PEP-CTERM sorting domain-containing protein [bacterium]|nr:PEP-CTERM sorting domain-containing protein [bacterium]